MFLARKVWLHAHRHCLFRNFSSRFGSNGQLQLCFAQEKKKKNIIHCGSEKSKSKLRDKNLLEESLSISNESRIKVHVNPG